MKKNCLNNLLAFGFICITALSFAQDATLSGNIKDKENGEDLSGVVVTTEEMPSIGTVTNPYGFYSLSLPSGVYTVIYRYIGYQTIKKKINLTKSVREDVSLGAGSVQIKEVSVKGEKEDYNIRSVEIGVEKITPKDVEQIPVIFGERDLMKIVQLLPGISPAGEGQSGFFVRGGTPDQNLILLDESAVYNASHLLGFFSVFNSAAVKSLDVYKGYIPSRFGGRLSSVVDIKMKEGNMRKKLSGEGNIGVISSNGFLEGAIKKDKGSFMISGRRTYVDLFTPFAPNPAFRDAVLYFYDLNAKFNYKLGRNDRLFVSGYLGRDVLGLSTRFNIDWGNRTATLRWNHIFNDKLFVNTSYMFSDFDYKFSLNGGNASFGVSSNIIDNTLKQDYNYYFNSSNTIAFGLGAVYRSFAPGEIEASSGGINDNKLDDKNNLEVFLYLENKQKINEVLTLKYGLRYTNLSQFGPGTIYEFDDNGDEVSEKEYNRGEIVSNYHLFSPRVGATYLLDELSSIKASYSRTYQTIHLISNPSASTPFDTWLPSSNNIKPSSGDQISIGYFRNFKSNMFQFSVEGYFKNESNLREFKTDANIVFNPRIEQGIYSVSGRSYGLEWLFKKTKGNLTGWVSYTLSKTERQHNEINNGDWFSSIQDRTHDISVIAMYSLFERVKLSATFVYYTGAATTFSSNQFYQVGGRPLVYYNGRNLDRLPDYHRLDLGITLEGRPYKKVVKNPETGEIVEQVKRRIVSDWNLSLYNVYNRNNAYTVTPEPSLTATATGTALNVRFQQLSLFGIVPSISWKFKF